MLTVGELVLHIENEPPPSHLGCPDCEVDCTRPCTDALYHCLICGLSF